jgi:hypothetical protein
MITVRIAHAVPRLGKPAGGEPDPDPRVPAAARVRGFLVVLADDAGHRALPAWLPQDPDGTPLPMLLDRSGDDIWQTAGIPEELAIRLVSAAGGSVTGIEIQPERADVDEVTEQTCTARIELGGPSGARHLTEPLSLGLALAAAAGAPVRVTDAVMDRLAVPVPDGDVLAPFRDSGLEAGDDQRAGRQRVGVIIDRRRGRLLQVPAGHLPGTRPRFEPRNMAFGDGLDRWDLEPGDQVRSDYSAAAEGGSAVLYSVSGQPRGPAVLAQAVFADDFRGAAVVFSGELRTEDVDGQAGLCLEILRPGWRHAPDRGANRTATVTGRVDWSRREITAEVPEDADMIRFGVMLGGRGRVWLRNPELRPVRGG